MAVNNTGKSKSNKDKEMAARLKREGVCRVTGRCATCYGIISVESWKSRYNHICR